MPMRPGRLRFYLTVERAVETKNARGQVVLEWRVLDARWCDVTPLRGEEAERARQTVATASVQVRFRYWPELDEKDRILFHDRRSGRKKVLNVVHVSHTDEREEETIALCEERAA